MNILMILADRDFPPDIRVEKEISMLALHYVDVNKCNAALEVLPFQDRSFDLIIGAEILEHLPEHVYRQVNSGCQVGLPGKLRVY